MTRRIALALVVLLALAALAAAQSRPTPSADKRVALVIGNAAYAVGRLNNPSNDARGMAEALRASGFDVIAVQDAKNLEMRRAVVEFGERLSQGGVGLFYYSGHGMQVGGRNYLLPVDADLKSERYISVESLDVDSVLAQMDAAKSAVNVVILDACRDNPFARQFRSASRGLAFMDAPTGTYIAYATSPGNVAEDGKPGQYGVYTGELLKAMREPGLRIEDVFKRVRQGVIAQTKGRQSPWDASSLTGEFFFRSGTIASVQPAPAAPVPPPAPVIREEIRQELGSLALSARLEGVEVFLRDQKIGETRSGRAIVIDNLTVGTHRVRARKSGYKDWERDVQVTSGQRAEIVIDLEPFRSQPVESPAKVIVDDDFRTNKGWATGKSEFCDKRYAPEGYVVTTASDATGCSIFRTYNNLPMQARIELTFHQLKGPLEWGIGLIFGYTGDVHHALLVAANPKRSMQLGYFDRKAEKQKWTALVPWRTDSNVNEGYGVSNTVAVEIRGPAIRCFVNDRFVTSATSPHPTTGRLGLALDRSGQEAVFTRLRIKELARD